ncbi:MAG TPA: LmeA family phospholipid-binding protein [Chloroflexota bacterium]
MKTLFVGVLGAVVGAAATVALSVLGQSEAVPGSSDHVQRAGQSAVQVTVSETWLNQQVAAATASERRYRNPRVDLRPPDLALVTAEAEVEAAGQRLVIEPTVTLRLQVAQQGLAVHVVSVEVGSLPVPQTLVEQQLAGLEQQVETQLNRTLGERLVGLGLRPLGLETTDNALTLSLGE